MAKRFPQVKRYGLEGAESMIVALDALFRGASECAPLFAPLFIP